MKEAETRKANRVKRREEKTKKKTKKKKKKKKKKWPQVEAEGSH